MNLVLFDPSELDAGGRGLRLPRSDARAAHVLTVLRRREGEAFDAGLINGPRGKATLAGIDGAGILLTFAAASDPAPAAVAPAPPDVTLIVGLPRPQTARKILFEAATLGVRAMHFVATEKTDPNYAASTLWSSGEWRRHLVDAAQQAFDTRLPEVTWSRTLAEALADVADDRLRIALDNYEAAGGLHELTRRRQGEPGAPAGAWLAVGPERGWGADDRRRLREAGFTLAHLGPRVLRVETAVTAALGVLTAP